VEVSARAATVEDLPAVAELAGEAVAELTPVRGGAVWRRQSARMLPTDESLRSDLDDAWSHVVAGTIDGSIVGYGVVRAEELPGGGVLGVISDLYTLPGARGVGVGEVVMDELIEWCRQQGCFGVDSLALPGDRETKNFFESFGLVARAIVVHRSLDPE
jgi:GNAT superfamily N-acetyltransferase